MKQIDLSYRKSLLEFQEKVHHQALGYADPCGHLSAWSFSTELCRNYHLNLPPCFFPSDFSNRPGIRDISSSSNLVNSCPALKFYHEYRNSGIFQPSSGLANQRPKSGSQEDLLCFSDYTTSMNLNSYTPLQANFSRLSNSASVSKTPPYFSTPTPQEPENLVREEDELLFSSGSFFECHSLKTLVNKRQEGIIGSPQKALQESPEPVSEQGEGKKAISYYKTDTFKNIMNYLVPKYQKTKKLPKANVPKTSSDVPRSVALVVCAGAWSNIEVDCAERCVLKLSELIDMVNEYLKTEIPSIEIEYDSGVNDATVNGKFDNITWYTYT